MEIHQGCITMQGRSTKFSGLLILNVAVENTANLFKQLISQTPPYFLLPSLIHKYYRSAGFKKTRFDYEERVML